MILNEQDIKTNIKGSRILGVDFGLKRVGLAVSDELGITTTPLDTLDYSKQDFWERLITIINKQKVKACVVGVPFHEKQTDTDIINALNVFVDLLRSKSGMDVYVFDESFTSRNAVQTMLAINKPKKKRSQKGEKDKIAAALILRNFLDYYLG
ncbi:MAG: Holliday junction resolvase RuvX [Ignavibacteria bacterium]|nr:Holliday junction resolvase RuvX [Ignavibacteria bacterium]